MIGRLMAKSEMNTSYLLAGMERGLRIDLEAGEQQIGCGVDEPVAVDGEAGNTGRVFLPEHLQQHAREHDARGDVGIDVATELAALLTVLDDRRQQLPRFERTVPQPSRVNLRHFTRGSLKHHENGAIRVVVA